jgi:TPR repeat protein
MENAARQGHIEALKWVSMAYWEGTGVAVDQKKATDYMAYAAQHGNDPMAEAIYRSMLAEPIRQENARRAQEMAEAAANQKSNFWASVNASVDAWARSLSSSSSYSSSGSSWQSTASIMDQGNWNQFIGYMSGSTTACPSTNRYC